MNYLKKYNTFEEYNTDKNNLPSPSIAYVLSTNTIYYNGDGYNNQSVIADGDTIIYNTDLIYLKKDGSIYPVSHPDLSTQPSILPQRYGNLDIKEVLIANGREDEIPLSATIIEAFSFNKKECVSAICMKGQNKWSITNTEGIIPEFTLIRYVGDDLGYYYEEEGDNNLKYDYSKDYLTFESLEDGTFQFGRVINYSIDGGNIWTELAANTATPTITAGNKIIWKAELTPNSSSGIGTFSSTGNFNVEGNPMSLLYGDNFIGQIDLTEKDYTFLALFGGGYSKLINAENFVLPATTLATGCYRHMFYDCTSLITAPELPATTLATDCYSNMFYGCTSLITAPELPATILIDYCYQYMFYSCTSLITAPELPATTLAEGCYNNMFYNCTSLITAPELPATTLADYCYQTMFYGCTNLNYIRAMFTTTPGSSYTSNWVSGVAATGTFVKNPNAIWDVTGVNGVPTGWTVEYGDLNKYLTFEALENGTFKFTNAINYSIDSGTTWVALAANTTTPIISSGNKILWKAELTPGNSIGIGKFSSTGNFNVKGNPMSLLYGDNFIGQTNLTGENSTFRSLFSGCSKLINAKNVSLPATTLKDSCYEYMFRECTSLITVPELSATTLATDCYYGMFYGCTSLTTAPELPATTLADNCYCYIFRGCTSLTTAPELPATTLADDCYCFMFKDCTSLTTAPELPATTLAGGCYMDMFSGCTSLTTAPELSATTLATDCYYGMFYGCTSLTTAPELPATTLVDNCYDAMFYGCTSLTTAPELPATILATNCYGYMFKNCTSLNYIKAMFTTTPSVTYTESWVYRVAATGTFVKNSAATWTTTGGVNSVPSGWTIQTASS